MELEREILRATFSDNVSDEAIDLLLSEADIVTYPARTFICRQGEIAQKMFILLDGHVGIYAQIDNSLYQIDNIRSGTFGEISVMVDGIQTRTAHIMTHDETRVLEVKGSSFRRFARDNPQVVAEIAKLVIKRILEQDKRNLVKLKAKKDQLTERSSTTFSLDIVEKLFEDLPLDYVARKVFSKVSVYKEPKEDPQYQTDIFMITPFREDLRPVYQSVKKLVNGMGMTIKRGDDFYSPNTIMAEIWSVTYAASLIICDCTGKNPNVFYELGIAHTLGKPTILLTQDAEDVPFDLRSYRFIVYSPDRLDELANNLEEAINLIKSL
jgi:CRP-like cAMP-binding protein